MALPNVKAGKLQCFFCGRFGNTYSNRGCELFEKNGDRAGAHWKDWRKVTNGYYYSLDVLFSSQYSLKGHRQHHRQPEVKSVNVGNEDNHHTTHISALDWSSENLGMIDGDNEIPTEYLFDGGATDAVSNSRSQLINYLPLPSPIPIKTATNDSNAVIIGKGQLQIKSEEGDMTVIDDVYYCPKATSTIISPGALIAKGAHISMNDKNNFTIKLKNGKTIYAVHKNRRWFINPRYPCKTPYTKICAIHSSEDTSRLWHNRLGHVSMKRIKRLFKHHNDYGLPPLKGSQDVTCEDCLKCKSTRNRILGRTNREPRLLDIVVTDVAGPFTACVTGEKLLVTFRDVATSYSEVCLIKHKSEVHQRLMTIVKKWERETGMKVKTIRSDRGGEYI